MWGEGVSLPTSSGNEGKATENENPITTVSTILDRSLTQI